MPQELALAVGAPGVSVGDVEEVSVGERLAVWLTLAVVVPEAAGVAEAEAQPEAE